MRAEWSAPLAGTWPFLRDTLNCLWVQNGDGWRRGDRGRFRGQAQEPDEPFAIEGVGEGEQQEREQDAEAEPGHGQDRLGNVADGHALPTAGGLKEDTRLRRTSASRSPMAMIAIGTMWMRSLSEIELTS